MAERSIRSQEPPDFPKCENWNELSESLWKHPEKLDYFINVINLKSYQQANSGGLNKSDPKGKGKYAITFCNTAKEGKVYIRKEEVKSTIYFILFKNHPKFKGNDDMPCKVGYTHFSQRDRTEVIIQNTVNKLTKNTKYKQQATYKFEVIKLPISATSTVAFNTTETTIREKFGTLIAKKAAKVLCLDAPREWIKTTEKDFNDLKTKLNKFERKREQVPSTQFFYDWLNEKSIEAGAEVSTSQGPGGSGGDPGPSEGAKRKGKGKDPGPSKSNGGTGKGKDPGPSKST